MYAYANSTLVKLHNEKKRDCELSDEALYGMKLEILDNDGDWYKIQTPYRYTGWVNRDELFFGDASLFEQTEKQVMLWLYADIMAEPKVQSFPLATVTRGAILGKTEETFEESWVKVVLVDGRCGWTHGSYFGKYYWNDNPADEAHLRRMLTETAKLYLGTQYRWGGKSPLGIDCSGLCSMSYLLNGIAIYRDAKIVDGFPIKPIPYEQAKEGDLLFFPGHVAMYLGNGRFIHSTAHAGTEGVCFNSLNPADPDFRADLLERLKGCGSIF